MRVLITAGPTWEPIDAVRYIGNRSSGRMGMALVRSALNTGCDVTLVLGPVPLEPPPQARLLRVETTGQMLQAVLTEFPHHDLLIMAAAVADYRPKSVVAGKLPRDAGLNIELEATPDILAEVGKIKRPEQRTVGFSLVEPGDVERTRQKLFRKNLDLIVSNSLGTMNSQTIEPTLLWPDGRSEALPCRDKVEFADNLLQRAWSLFA